METHSDSSTGKPVHVVVVGGGGAGLSAAITAAEEGAVVTVLEKESRLGGTTSLSVGSITAAGTRLQRSSGIKDDSPEAHFDDLDVVLGPLHKEDNLDLRRVLTQNVPSTIDWLESLGISFLGPFDEAPHRTPRMHVVLPNSKAFIFFLQRRCRELGVKVILNAKVEQLLMAGKNVVGIRADVGGASREIKADSVILATGDYSAAVDLKKRFIPELSDVDAINPSSTGDGHRMALAEHAVVRQGGLVAGPKLRFKSLASKSLMASLPPYKIITKIMRFGFGRLPKWLLRPLLLPTLTSYLSPELSLFREGAILVNRDGRRFLNESSARTFDLHQQPNKCAYVILDKRIAEKYSAYPHYVSTAPGVAYAYLSDYADLRKDIYTSAKTLEELADKLGLPEGSLSKTVNEYNARNTEVEPKTSLGNGPFHALGPVYSWLVVTQGGLAVDEQHRVLREDGSCIGNLYAVGNVGLGGLIIGGHGHYLGWAFTSGRRAGRFAAQGTPGS